MPQIDRATLTKHCKAGKRFPVYYLFGDESHYIQLYRTSLVRFLLDQNITDLNYSRYDADHLNDADLDAELESLPPFCPCRVVEIDRADPATLCTTDRSATDEPEAEDKKQKRKKLAERWKERIHNLPDTSILVLVDNLSLRNEKALSSDSAHKQLCKEIEAVGGACVFLGKESPSTLIDLIVRRAAKHQVTFDKKLAASLVGNTDEGISFLLQETDKLIAWAGSGGVITKEALDLLTNGQKEEPYYLFADHVASGKTVLALQDLDRLLSYANPPEMILSTLAKTFCSLYRARAALDVGVGMDRYCSDFSLSAGYTQTKTFQNARNYDLSLLRRAVLLLEECEEKLKSTTLSKEVLLQQTVVQIAALKEEIYK